MSFLILCLTILASFAVLFLVAKFIGIKQIAQFDFFDYITGITISSIADEMATELEEPRKPFVAMVIYRGITLLLSTISNKFPRSRKYLNGTSTILIDRGKLYCENLKKAKLDLIWLDKQLKRHKVRSARDVFLAVCNRKLNFVLYEKDHEEKTENVG